MIARMKYLCSTIDSTGSNHQNKTVTMTKTKTTKKENCRDRRHNKKTKDAGRPLKMIGMIDKARNRGK